MLLQNPFFAVSGMLLDRDSRWIVACFHRADQFIRGTRITDMKFGIWAIHQTAMGLTKCLMNTRPNCLVSGHDFSRAECPAKIDRALAHAGVVSPLVERLADLPNIAWNCLHEYPAASKSLPQGLSPLCFGPFRHD